MFAHIRMRSSGLGRWRTASLQRQSAVAAVLLAFGLALQGCANLPPSPYTGPDPADPQARAPAATYRSVTSPYDSRRPFAPKPWRNPSSTVVPQNP
jgi:hypothetical protein